MKFNYVALCQDRHSEAKQVQEFVLFAEHEKKLPYPIFMVPNTSFAVDFLRNTYRDMSISRKWQTITKGVFDGKHPNPIRGLRKDIPINIMFLSITELNYNYNNICDMLLTFNTVNLLVNSLDVETELKYLASKAMCEIDEYPRYLNPFVYRLLNHMEFID